MMKPVSTLRVPIAIAPSVENAPRWLAPERWISERRWPVRRDVQHDDAAGVLSVNDADGRSLLIHCLDATDADAVRDDIKSRYEARLKRIFA